MEPNQESGDERDELEQGSSCPSEYSGDVSDDEVWCMGSLPRSEEIVCDQLRRQFAECMNEQRLAQIDTPLKDSKWYLIIQIHN